MSDQHKQAYQDALVDAKAELEEIQSHFDRLARRKAYLGQVIDAMAPLLGHVQPAAAQQQHQPASQQFQSAQQQFSHADQQFAPAQQQAAPGQQEFSALPARTFEPLIGHEPEKQEDIFANFANTDPTADTAQSEQPTMQAAAQPEQENILKQNETRAPEQQSAEGDIDKRINFALNFALLS